MFFVTIQTCRISFGIGITFQGIVENSDMAPEMLVKYSGVQLLYCILSPLIYHDIQETVLNKRLKIYCSKIILMLISATSQSAVKYTHYNS